MLGDQLFGSFQWYRRFVGGTWYLAVTNFMGPTTELWTRELPPSVVRVRAIEDYADR